LTDVRIDKTRAFAVLLVASGFIGTVAAAAQRAPNAQEINQRVQRVLAASPIIDGHNDLPYSLRQDYATTLWTLDLTSDSRKWPKPLHTDLTRLRAGGVGAQFWSVWVPPNLAPADAVKATLEQIDLVREMVARYPDRLELASTAADIRRIEQAGRIASLIGVEGGGQIGNSLAVLRQYHALGARYLTLTHSLTTDWADSATALPKFHGLNEFGKAVVMEMNRLGMIVDLSHVSPETMKAALAITTAPVMYSHSSARAVNDHPRNVPDDVLQMVAANGGVVMVNFYSGFISTTYRDWDAKRKIEQNRLNMPQYGEPPPGAKEALAEWEKKNPRPVVKLAQVADHFDHIRKVAGVDHVGIGSDYDGVDDLPRGLEGVECYPALLAELARRGWSDEDLAKVTGGNILRLMEGVEAAASKLKGKPPIVATLEPPKQ
jgi:membrane dipeptidase